MCCELACNTATANTLNSQLSVSLVTVTLWIRIRVTKGHDVIQRCLERAQAVTASNEGKREKQGSGDRKNR